jgi:Cu+-exporting ATPase
VPAPGFDEAELLRLAASVERASEHPLALAIVEAAKDRGIPTSDVTDFDSRPDAARSAPSKAGGSCSAMRGSLPTKGLRPTRSPAGRRLRRDGATAIFIGVDGTVGGAFAIADPVKPTTPEALAALKAEGIRVVMLTGDNRTTAEAVARRSASTRSKPRCCPTRRAPSSRGSKRGRVVAMAGDGVNDAPRWPPPMSVSPWARAPTSRSRARA